MYISNFTLRSLPQGSLLEGGIVTCQQNFILEESHVLEEPTS